MKKIRVGIMGTGDIARAAAMTLKRARGLSCYAVGSRAYARAEEFSRENGIKVFYGSYQELVNDPKVDLIYVATPHSEHFENAKLAIQARKAVLVEKAFTLNEQQAAALISMAIENNVFIAEAIWTRYMPMRAKIREILSTEIIGFPTMITAGIGYPISHRERMRDPALGGGALLDLGVYPLNFASMIFGNDVMEISSACTKGDTGVDLQTVMTLTYRDGRVAQLSCTSTSVSDRRGVIYGTRGYVVVNNINNPESLEVYDINHRKIQTVKRRKQISGYEYEFYACAAAIRNGQLECADMPHAETLKMMNMMDFIRGQIGVRYPGEDGYVAPMIPQQPFIETESGSAAAPEVPALTQGSFAPGSNELPAFVSAVPQLPAAETGTVAEAETVVEAENVIEAETVVETAEPDSAEAAEAAEDNTSLE